MANNKRSRSKRASKKVKHPRDHVFVDDEASKLLCTLMEAFSLASPQQVAAAYKEANGDLNRAAEILAKGDTFHHLDNDDDPTSSTSIETTSTLGFTSASSSTNGSSSMSTGSSSEDGLMEIGKGFREDKGKKVVASTGSVSTILGRDYVASTTTKSPRKDYSAKGKDMSLYGLNGDNDRDDAEQFLYSMLGDQCALSMQVVRDAFYNCGYDVEKALDIMLELSSSSHEPMITNRESYFADEACYRLSESEIGNYVQYMDLPARSYANVVVNPETRSCSSLGKAKTNLSQTVLDSLFNVSKFEEHEPSTMNWRNVARKMKSLGEGFDQCSSGFDEQKKKLWI